MSDLLVDIKPSAQEYLRGLLAKQESPGIAVRIFVERPGTPHAECCMAYCLPGEETEGDVRYAYDGFDALIEGKSVPYLIDAVIDYKKDAWAASSLSAPRVPKCRISARTPRWKRRSTITSTRKSTRAFPRTAAMSR